MKPKAPAPSEIASEIPGGFTVIPNWVVDTVLPSLSPGAVMVYLTLARGSYGNKPVYFSNKTIGQKCGLGERSVRTGLRDLETAGLLRNMGLSEFGTVRYLIVMTPPAEFCPPRQFPAATPRQNFAPKEDSYAKKTTTLALPAREGLDGPTKEAEASPGSGAEGERFTPGLWSPTPPPPVARPPSPALMANFDRFWAAYPKKRAKGDAEKAWAKLNPPVALQDSILGAIRAAKGSKDWQKENGQFIPYPATWLRRRGWEDELEAAKQRKEFVI